jgi:hypothetical protein
MELPGAITHNPVRGIRMACGEKTRLVIVSKSDKFLGPSLSTNPNETDAFFLHTPVGPMPALKPIFASPTMYKEYSVDVMYQESYTRI